LVTIPVSENVDPPSSPRSDDRILIAVCTLNEAQNIGPLILQLRQALPTADILIVDDNSTDDTGQVVSQLASHDSSISLRVRTNERGLGTAIRYAMSYAIKHDYDYLLNLDGDFSHAPGELADMLGHAQQDASIDVVVGSRYAPGGSIVGWPMRRRIMSRMVNQFATLCLRLPVSDCSGSMRCYRVAALRTIDIASLESSGYSVFEELLLRLHRHQAKIAELPITFTERQQGNSKLTMTEAVRSAWAMVMMAVRT
jgi:dolichol-phosphate mannosyltransferase